MKLYHGTTNNAADYIEKEGFRGSVLSEFTGAGEWDDESGVVFAAFTAEEAAEYGDAIFEIDAPAEIVHRFNDRNTDHAYITLSDMIEIAWWQLVE